MIGSSLKLPFKAFSASGETGCKFIKVLFSLDNTQPIHLGIGSVKVLSVNLNVVGVIPIVQSLPSVRNPKCFIPLLRSVSYLLTSINYDFKAVQDALDLEIIHITSKEGLRLVLVRLP